MPGWRPGRSEARALSFLPNLGYVLDAGSGALLLGLGLLVAWVRPRRPVQGAFALFAGSFGLMALLGNLTTLDDPLQGPLQGAATLFVVPALAGLVLLALMFPRPLAPGERWAAALAGSIALGLGGAHAGLRMADMAGFFGLSYALEALQFGFYFALLVLALRFPRGGEPGAQRERAQAALMTAALLLWPGLFAAYRASLAGGLPDLGHPNGAFGAMGLGAFGLVAALWLRDTRGAEPSAAKLARNLALASLAAPVAGRLAVLLVLPPTGTSGLNGAVRIATVAVLAYAILRHQLLDVDLKLKRTIRQSTLVALFLGVYLVVSGVAQLFLPVGTGPLVAVIIAGLLLFTLAPLQRFAERVATVAMPHVGPSDAPRPRDIEAYRAALEQALAQSAGSLTEKDAAILAQLRAKLGITDREHAVLEHVVRASGPRGPEDAFAPGTLVLGRYRVTRLLGEGAFGRTYLAEDAVLHRPVVVKSLRRERAERPEHMKAFLREARLLGSLQHPNLVTVYDVEVVGDQAYLVLEYLDGGSLEELLARGPLPLAEALRVADGVLAGLEAAHERRIVHRDVKPANVLLTSQGGVKVSDFGAARQSPAQPETQSGLTLAGGGKGTLATMSPEAARGAEVDARADLYAVGAVLVRMLAGRPYLDLEGLSEFEAREAILTQPPELPLEGMPAAVNAALARALAKDPAERFPSARAMRESLGAAAGASARRAPATGRLTRV